MAMDKLKEKIRNKRYSYGSNSAPDPGFQSFLQKPPSNPEIKVDLEFAKFCSTHEDSRVVRRNMPLVTMNTKGRPFSVSDVPTGKPFVLPVRRMGIRCHSPEVCRSDGGFCLEGIHLLYYTVRLYS